MGRTPNSYNSSNNSNNRDAKQAQTNIDNEPVNSLSADNADNSIPEIDNIKSDSENEKQMESNLEMSTIKEQNELLKQELASMQAKLDELAKGNTIPTVSANENKPSNISSGAGNTVSIYCAVDISDGFDFTINYDGKTMKFDKFFQRKTISIDEFKNLAGTYEGQYHLDNRNIFVGGAIPEDIVEGWNLDYKKGELLEKNTLSKLLDIPMKDLVSAFKDLCDNHKMIIARRFVDAFYSNDNRASKDKIVALNNISKNDETESGIFKEILKQISEREIATY